MKEAFRGIAISLKGCVEMVPASSIEKVYCHRGGIDFPNFMELRLINGMTLYLNMDSPTLSINIVNPQVTS